MNRGGVVGADQALGVVVWQSAQGDVDEQVDESGERGRVSGERGRVSGKAARLGKLRLGVSDQTAQPAPTPTVQSIVGAK